MINQLHLTKAVGAQMRDRLFAAGVVLSTLAALVYLRLYNPGGGEGFYPSCPLFMVTGLYCPGCGTLRGLHQLLHGHLFAALGFNPLMVLALPFIAYAYLSYTLLAIRGRGLRRYFVPPVLIKVLFWVVVSFGILRNIPVYPFSLLAP